MLCLSALNLGCFDRYKSKKCEVVEEIPVFGPQLLGLIDYCFDLGLLCLQGRHAQGTSLLMLD